LRIRTLGETEGHADIEYRTMRIAGNNGESAIVNLLRFMDPPTALVFCATRQAVRHLEAILREHGFAAVSLSGELSQNERNHALQALRDGRARVCVATDVAARGLDLPNLGLVIHADLPNDAEVLQHRSGRTGRAGRKGVSILLVPNSRRRRAEEMLSRARVQFTWTDPPSAEDIRKLDRDRLLQNPILTEPSSDEELAMANSLLAAYAPRDIAAAFVKMYRATLPAAEEIADVSEPRRERRDTQGPQESRPAPNRRERRLEQFETSKPEQGKRSNTPRRAGEMENGVWFKISVGRERNADPKWLLPEICRQGEITKKDIGSIRVYERETRFEVSPDVAESFATRVAARQKGGVRISAAPDGPSVDTAPASAVSLPSRERDGKPRFVKNKTRRFAGKREGTKAKH
jgi:ATP-dependent RNA helicase DeaD